MFLKEFFKRKKCSCSCFVLSLVGGVVTVLGNLFYWCLVKILHSLSRCIHFIILFFVKCGCKTLLDRVS